MRTSTAQEIYTSSVRDLPPSERLRLAALILDGLAGADTLLIERRDDWSGEDVRDLVTYTTSYASSQYPEDESIA
jgi:hypothetical protein